MQAVYFPSSNQVETGVLPDPVASRGEVIIRVRASGICHTDIEVMRGNYGTSTFPLVPGHEFAGEIAEIGEEVSGVSVGDRVVVDPNIECGTCRACKRDWAHLCENLGAYGVTQNGGFAEYCTVQATAIHPIGEMDFQTAALAEPMGCVLNGLSPLAGRKLERAAIIGTGPMGLLMGLALKARGISDIIMLDLNEDRLSMAKDLGLVAMPVGVETSETLHHACDLAVDATGVPAVVETLPDYVANGGAALIFGVCPSDAEIKLSPFEIFRRQLSIFGTHSLNHNIPEALEALKSIGPAVNSVVTHNLPAEGIANAMSGKPPIGSMKVQVTF